MNRFQYTDHFSCDLSSACSDMQALQKKGFFSDWSFDSTNEGSMLIVVNNKYTYECGFKVRIGDKVKLPKGAGNSEWVGTITALTSNYTGQVKNVIEIIERAPVDKKYNKYRFRSIHEPWEQGYFPKQA